MRDPHDTEPDPVDPSDGSDPDEQANRIALGIALGMPFGVLLSLLLDNWAMVGIGLALGIALGVAFTDRGGDGDRDSAARDT